ncbi:MAG: 50S ribosomal protein L29 [Candidatus Woesearchaeota archaeon]
MSKRFKEISSMGKEELRNKLMELKKELVKLKAQVSTGTPPKNPSNIRNTRRMMARILMLLNRKELEEKLAGETGKKTEEKTA